MRGFVYRVADAPAAGSHLGHTRVVRRVCWADEFFRGDGFGGFELVEDVAVTHPANAPMMELERQLTRSRRRGLSIER